MSRKRRELGEDYTRSLDAIYAPGVPGGAGSDQLHSRRCQPQGAASDHRAQPQIYADLTAPTATGDLLDVSQAHTLTANLKASFQGASKKAKFEIDAQLARDWLRQPNPHGRPSKPSPSPQA